MRDPQGGVGIERARAMQGHDLAEAVAGDKVRTDTSGVQQGKLRQGGGSDGRLRLRCQGVVLAALCVCAERRGGEHRVLQALAIAAQLIPHLAREVELHGDLGAHADVLAALAGKDERKLACLRGAESGVHAGLCDEVAGAAQLIGQACELVAQVIDIRRYQRGTRGGRRIEGELTIARACKESSRFDGTCKVGAGLCQRSAGGCGEKK